MLKVDYQNNIYFYCDLCLKVYRLTPEGVELETSRDIIADITRLHLGEFFSG